MCFSFLFFSYNSIYFDIKTYFFFSELFQQSYETSSVFGAWKLSSQFLRQFLPRFKFRSKLRLQSPVGSPVTLWVEITIIWLDMDIADTTIQEVIHLLHEKISTKMEPYDPPPPVVFHLQFIYYLSHGHFFFWGGTASVTWC